MASALNRARLWLRANLQRGRHEREMREEMSEHLDRATALLVARGQSEEDARRNAARDFGNMPYLESESRESRGTLWLDALAADVRFALRHFARKPVTTLVMFVVLALGMSISTLLFSYVHSYAVQPPLGVELQDDLVRIRGSRVVSGTERGARAFTEDEFRAYRGMSSHFDEVAGWTFATVLMDASDDAEGRALEARATFVTPNWFSTLGVRPVLGAGLPTQVPDDPSLSNVVVIGHPMWENLYSRDPGVIGSTLRVNGVDFTVVGVAPERFTGIGGFVDLQMWLPLEARDQVVPGTAAEFRAIARLRAGVSEEAATAAVRLVGARAVAESPELREGNPSTDVVQLLSANGDPMFKRDVRLITAIVGFLGVLVLLVTCTNVSALLTGLAAARRHEIAVRLSLGAARSRIMRQLLTESALLAMVAAAAALGVASLVVAAVAKYLPDIPMDLTIEWEVTTFTFGVALGVGVLFGLSPALHATRLALAAVMRDSSGAIAATRARLQRTLVVAQIAFTQPLVVVLSALLLFVVAEYAPPERHEAGDRLVRMPIWAASPISVTTTTGAEARLQVDAAIARLAEHLRATPGIEDVIMDWGFASSLELGAYRSAVTAGTVTTPDDEVVLSGLTPAEGYFRINQIPLVRGRDFEAGDVAPMEPGARDVPVIIGADLAARLWPGADPVGRRLESPSDTVVSAASLIVIGVVDDPVAVSRRPGDEYQVYVPPDTSRSARAMLIRTAANAEPLLPTLRKVVQQEVPGMYANPRVLAHIEEYNIRNFRIITGSISSAGLITLLLSAIGLYAVIAFAVGERTREIAVRMAVGARRQQIVQRFVRDGLRLGLFGLLIGLPVSVAGLRLLMGFLGDDIPRVDLTSVTFLATLGVLITATVAAWLPARSAASIDPAVSLRRE